MLIKVIEIPLAIGLFIIAFVRIRKEPRRFSNGVILAQGCFFLVRGCIYLWKSFVPMLTPLGGGYYEPTFSADLMLFLIFFYLLFFVILGIGLIVSGVKLLIKESISLTHILPIGFGLFNLTYVILYIRNLFYINDYSLKKMVIDSLQKFILDTALFIPFMIFAYFLYSLVYKLVRKKQKPDYIIVLGASLINDRVSPLLARRLDKGIELYKKHGSTSKFVVSGGQGSDEVCSEADAMARYLIEQGIPKDQILLENQSVNTMENLKFSKKVIEKDTQSAYYCAVVTNNFHMLRGAIYSRAAGLPADSYGCKTAAYYYPAAALRESMAFILGYKKFDMIAVGIFFVYNFLELILECSYPLFH